MRLSATGRPYKHRRNLPLFRLFLKLKRMLADPTSVGSKEYARVLAISGGLPIKVGDDVVGAVGVSGSPGRDDECSQAGIEKVAEYLK